MFSFGDDATVVWHASGTAWSMTEKTLDQRVAILEASMGGKTLEEHFREHAELIDRRFTLVDLRFAGVHARFNAQDKRFEAIDAQFSAVHSRLDAMDERFSRIDSEIADLRGDLRRGVTGVHAKLDVILKKFAGGNNEDGEQK